jgi:glycosyltransferase involved in cell wall biosynthesis
MARIVIDARESGTTTGRYVDKLIEYLYKLKPDFEIIILTKSPRLDYIKKIAPGFKAVESNFKEFSSAEQLGLFRQLKSLKPDLVHFAMDRQPILYRGRVIATMHDLTTTRFNNPAKNRLVFKSKQQVYKRVLKDVARKSLYVITPSEFVKHDVAQYAKIDESKIFVTYEAADKISAPAEPIKNLTSKNFIMYVGRPLPHKNLWRLVEAFAQLKPAHPDLRLVLAGKKDGLYEQLERKVKKHGISNVVFSGFVSEGQLRWLYQNTAAYVFPSLSEGFGLPPLEAMVHGAPVISSNATCLPEINGPAALYFDPLDSRDMAAKINQLLVNPDLRSELIKKGAAQAGKYSWRRMAEQTLDIYNKALAK